MQENTRKSKVYMCKSKVKQRPAIRGCEKGGLKQGWGRRTVFSFFLDYSRCFSFLSRFFFPFFLVFSPAWPAGGRSFIELEMKLAIAAFRVFSFFLVFLRCVLFFSRFLFFANPHPALNQTHPFHIPEPFSQVAGNNKFVNILKNDR